MKTCSKCKESKTTDSFPKRKDSFDGFRNSCKKCRKDYSKNYYEKRCIDNPGFNKEYYQKNRLRMIENNTRYSNKNKESKSLYDLNRYETVVKKTNNENRLYINNVRRIYRNKKLVNDINFRITKTCRNRILDALKSKNIKKKHKTIELIGCSIKKYRNNIEKQFTEGMSWKNHGVHGWHIDHIIPISSFDLTDTEEQKKAFHYTNVQPLWALDNWKKGKSNVIKG